MNRFAAALLGVLLAGFAGRAWGAETISPIVSPAAEGSRVFCDAAGAAGPPIIRKAPCSLRAIYVTTGAAAGYLMVFNAVSAPADGAVTPIECVSIPATSTISIDFAARAAPYATGLTAVFSTTGCFTKTVSATAFFHALVQ